MNLEHILIRGFNGIITFFGSILVIFFTIFFLATSMGYSLNGVGWEVAIKAAKKHDVNLCKKIWVIFNPLGLSPSTSDQRSDCIHEYASLTKDPSACELLMPSSYGWSCLGVAEKPSSRMCWFDFGDKAQKIGDSILPECGGREDSVAGRCCDMAKTLYIQKAKSCDTFSDSTILHDQCLELLAKRDESLDLCKDIVDDHVRTACEVEVRALLKK